MGKATFDTLARQNWESVSLSGHNNFLKTDFEKKKKFEEDLTKRKIGKMCNVKDITLYSWNYQTLQS